MMHGQKNIKFCKKMSENSKFCQNRKKKKYRALEDLGDILLLPVTLNRHKSDLIRYNGIWPLG